MKQNEVCRGGKVGKEAASLCFLLVSPTSTRICSHVCVHAGVSLHVHVCTHMNMCACVQMCMYVCMCEFTCTCVWVCMCMCCMSVHVCVHVCWGKVIAECDCREVASVTVYLAFLKPGSSAVAIISEVRIVLQQLAVYTAISSRDADAMELRAPVSNCPYYLNSFKPV